MKTRDEDFFGLFMDLNEDGYNQFLLGMLDYAIGEWEKIRQRCCLSILQRSRDQ